MDIKKLERNIKLKDFGRDFSWINRQYLKGRLTLQGVAFNAEIFETFRKAVKNTNEIYENAWDIDFYLSLGKKTIKGKVINVINVNIIGLIVHFPEITITNSRKKNHLIKDLFIRIGLSARTISSRNGDIKIIINNTEGMRMQMTYAEYSSGYCHSHLSSTAPAPSDANVNWSSFCTGSGHINEAISEVNADGFREEDFTKYLLYLHTLATWESLEGTPYKNFQNVFPRFTNATEFNNSRAVAISLYKDIIRIHNEKKIIPNINFILETGKFKIKDDNTFDTFLMSIPFTEDQKAIYLCKKDETGRYWKYGSQLGYNIPTMQYRSIFTFKGEPITFKINDLVEDKTKEDEYDIHPSIKETIKKEIEYDINTKTVRQSTINRYKDPVSDAREDIKPSKVLV